MKAPEADALLEAARKGDNDACERMMEENAGLIWSVVKRYYGRGTDPEDLYQLGCLGFLKAVRGFDPAFGCQFSTYAVPMIAGEIKRFIRDDGAVKVSRALKTLSLKLHKYIDEKKMVCGAEPSTEELSRIFGVDKQEIIYALDSNKYPLSLYEKYDDDNSASIMDRLPAKGGSDELIDNILLKKLLSELPQREKTVIKLRYFKDMTQSEIARIMGVSQVQISRIESKVIGKMREQLA